MADVPRSPDAPGKTIGLLTSGGDCAWINAVIRGRRDPPVHRQRSNTALLAAGLSIEGQRNRVLDRLLRARVLNGPPPQACAKAPDHGEAASLTPVRPPSC
jgi:hypothetical protein